VRLAGVREGDIVEAGGMHAVVIRRERGAVMVRGICNKSIRRVRADEIVAHWRRNRLRVAA